MRARFMLLAASAALLSLSLSTQSFGFEPGAASPPDAASPYLHPVATLLKTQDLQLQAAPQVQAQIQQLQQLKASKGWTFDIKMTSVSARPLASLIGDLPPPPAVLQAAPQVNAEAAKILQLYSRDLLKQKLQIVPLGCSASLSKWDWRTKGKVTPIKSQQCGDCWAFASIGQMESALLVAGWSAQDLSEQQMLSCSNAGSCAGGTRWVAIPWAVDNKVAKESAYPYEGGVKTACKSNIPGTWKLLASGWIDSSGNVAPTPTLKKAICDYGPISVSIYASSALQNYGGGVFNEQNNGNGTNHAILLIGWDDTKQAWLMKNSWGTGWGESGYGWVRFGSNNIGRWPFWAKAAHPKFVLSADIIAAIGKFKNLAVKRVPIP
jgi:C1A family cysteine protease